MVVKCWMIFAMLLSLERYIISKADAVPKPVKAYLHETIQLNCTKDREKILWLHNSKLIVKYGVIEKDYRARMSWNNVNDNDRNLVIRDVQLTDVGLYECLALDTLQAYDVIVNGEARTTVKYITRTLPTFHTENGETSTPMNINNTNKINVHNSLIEILLILHLCHKLFLVQ